jgi:hypothetical protein
MASFFSIQQLQSGALTRLMVPLVVQGRNGSKARLTPG